MYTLTDLHAAIIGKHDRLWRQASAYAEEHLTGDELAYYYRTID